VRAHHHGGDPIRTWVVAEVHHVMSGRGQHLAQRRVTEDSDPTALTSTCMRRGLCRGDDLRVGNAGSGELRHLESGCPRVVGDENDPMATGAKLTHRGGRAGDRGRSPPHHAVEVDDEEPTHRVQATVTSASR